MSVPQRPSGGAPVLGFRRPPSLVLPHALVGTSRDRKTRYGLPAVQATRQRRSGHCGNARVPSLPSGIQSANASHPPSSRRDRVDHAGVALKQDLPGNPLGPQLPRGNLDGELGCAWVAWDSDADRDVDDAVNRRDPITDSSATAGGWPTAEYSRWICGQGSSASGPLPQMTFSPYVIFRIS